jgi:RNA polymerase sigma factor (sigma-70 family)
MRTITTLAGAEFLHARPPFAAERGRARRGLGAVALDRRGDWRTRQERGGHDRMTRAAVTGLVEPSNRGGSGTPEVDSCGMSKQMRTTVVVQRFLDDLRGDSPAAPIVRELLSHAAERLRILCTSMLTREYSRLTRPPLNLRSEELLGGLVERLLKALKKTQPPTVRQFFALANQHMRWELNDLARRLDEHSHAAELGEELVPAPESSGSRLCVNARRMLEAIESLPDGEREAFELVRIQGMSTSEVAEIVGTTERTVQRRINRASLLLMNALADLRPPENPDRASAAGEV